MLRGALDAVIARVASVLLLAGCSAASAPFDPLALVARIAPARDATVADVGAGRGAFTHALAAASGHVIATDVDANALATLAQEASAAGETKIETRVVSRADTGLADRSVDLVFLCRVDHYFVDRKATFVALARAIRPGGRVVIVNTDRSLAPVSAAAAALGWHLLDSWRPAPGYFAQSYGVK